ncbi:MAG: signal peptidase II [Pseudomonadota bacterium]
MSRVPAVLLALAIFAVDQLVKYWVTGPLGIAQLGDVREIVSFFDLRFVPNAGVSLGLLPASGDAMRWALVALTGAIAGGVAVWIWRETNRQDLLALGMILGGALGNIVDRIRFGYVVDYADLHFGDFRPFLVFNIADAAITVGVLILLIRALLVRDRPAAPVENV